MGHEGVRVMSFTGMLPPREVFDITLEGVGGGFFLMMMIIIIILSYCAAPRSQLAVDTSEWKI